MRITPIFAINDDKFVIFDEFLLADNEAESIRKALFTCVKLHLLGLHFIGQFLDIDKQEPCFLIKTPYPGSGINLEIGLVGGPTFNQLQMVENGHELKEDIMKSLSEDITFLQHKHIEDNVYVMEMINLSEDKVLMVCIGIDSVTTKPYILLKTGEGDYQITPAKARELAWDLIMASGAAIEDGFMYRFLKESRPDLEPIERNQSIDAFRNYREEVLSEQETSETDSEEE